MMKKKIKVVLMSCFLLLAISIINQNTVKAYDLPPVDVICDTGGSGDCYAMRAITCPNGTFGFRCEATGKMDDHCSSFLVLICNWLQG